MTIYAADKLCTSAQHAIEVFDDRWVGLQQAGAPDTFATEFGESIASESPLIEFPYSQLFSKFVRTTGESRFRTFEDDSFGIKTVEYDDGAEERLYNLMKNPWAWQRWQKVPDRFLVAEAQLSAESIAALLRDGETIDCKPTQAKFFAANHRANPAHSDATWGNLQSSAVDLTDTDNLIEGIEAEAAAMSSSVLDENGDILGVNPDVIVCHPSKARYVTNTLKKTYHNGGDTNPEAGNWRVVSAKTLKNADDWYMLDSALCAMLPPWAIVNEIVDPALVLRWIDVGSSEFVHSGKVKVSKHIWKGYGLAFPYAIRKIKGA